MKKYIIGFIVGIIVSSIGVYAITSSDITYKNTTVDQALDTLYTNSQKKLPNPLIIPLSTLSYNVTLSTSTVNISNFMNSYTHFQITNLSKDDGIQTCTVRTVINNSNVDLNIDTEYNLSDVNRFWVNVTGKSTTGAACNYQLKLYN